MKILHCVSSLKVGGAEKLVKNLSLSQQANGQNVSILSFGDETDDFQQALKCSKIKIYNIVVGFLKKQYQLSKLIRQFDVIHIHSPAVIRAFLFISPLLMHKQVIYTIHGEVAPNLKGIKVSHIIARCYVNYTFAVSEQTKLKAKALFNWPVEKIIVIKNGVAISNVKIQTNNQEKLVIGTVSRLIPLKKIEDVIQCISDYGLSEKLTLKIYGDGPQRQMLEALVQTTGLTNHVMFMNNVIDESKIYPELDCLIISSETEGLPMVLLEAMASGVPCISSRVGAIPDIVTASEGGFLYDTGNISQLGQHLEFIYANKNILSEKGRLGQKYVASHFSIDDIAKTYQQYYGYKA
ncbi:glycosyltransferase family 4 protein [Colwellia sp. BRX10-3]|uniref:glycosyltransferase family 4 protein n=1 Tax=Colwellia sp. BRX10-3 TaxID=2759844 RepID=UPI0015F511FD|nr:glycosyltransferase family 4 protein [Colwellia sp. BRX10-3]MBA6391086.1 glycosyltransferase family 4 protein [Colwellia sp. BRX10-3]